MIVKTVPIGAIKPYDKNPRNNEAAVDKVAASIKEFGFKQPIVVDKDGIIIAGHTRLKAAQKLGIKEVPVIYADDLTDEQVKAYRLADNKTAEFAEWDADLLGEELTGLAEVGFDMEPFGFEPEEPTEIIEDEVPEPPEVPTAKLGDIWQLGRHRLMCGDSTNRAMVNKLMDGKRAEMCFTDPPWNVAIGLDSNPRHRQREGLINDKLPEEEFRAFLVGFGVNLIEACDGDLYCVLGASEWPTLDSILREVGYHWSSTIIWVKDVFVLGRSKYHRRYEPIWYGWQGKGKSSYIGDRSQDDVWEIPRPKRSEEHPTMKPISLVVRAIENSSSRNGSVIDLFGGSGTTLIAAEQLNRTCYMMELAPKYCDVIITRWENLTGQKAKLEGAIE